MANGPTEKQFQDLIEEQKKTNFLLLTDQERMMEEAYAENAARDEAIIVDNKQQEKTPDL